MEISASLLKHKEEVKTQVRKALLSEASTQISDDFSINKMSSVIETTDMTIKRLDDETARLEDLEKTMLGYIQGARSFTSNDSGLQGHDTGSLGAAKSMMLK